LERELRENESLLFILGAGKTATTSLCGLLNSHPDVFVMCEVSLNNSLISRYGTKLVKLYPEFLDCFFRPRGGDGFESYRKAHAMMRAKGYANRYFGDKMVGIDSGYADGYKDVRVIFSVRRLPEWIAKDSVRGWFPLDLDVVPFAVQYAKHFVESFLLKRVYHVRMEDFLGDNAAVVHGIWDFLGITPPEKAESWWETIGHYPPGDPKGALNWWRGHASSAVAPLENDTKVKVRKSAFWDEILPIFDKYYDGVRKRTFTRQEIEADLAQLQGMIGRYHHPFDTCFAAETSRSHNLGLKDKRRTTRRGPKAKLDRLLTRIGIR
jgi:hypothetical protein